LNIADWLGRREIQHRFVRETQEFQTPDIELTVKNREVYFEVKTMQENRYMQFAERVADKIRPISPGCGILPEKVRMQRGKEDELIAIAVREIKTALAEGLYSPIQYEGEEGEFSIVFHPGKGLDQRHPALILSWPETRVREDGTPWIESVLETTLRDNVGQFETFKPTFLVWVNFDKSLPGLDAHVSRVLGRYGATEFVNVAGVIVSDPFDEWDLTANPSYPHFQELERIGLFDAINAFKQRRCLKNERAG